VRLDAHLQFLPIARRQSTAYHGAGSVWDHSALETLALV
jgi:hypothetical protein